MGVRKVSSVCVKREVGSKTDGQRWARVAFRVLRRVEAALLLTWANCGCDVRMQVGGKRNSPAESLQSLQHNVGSRGCLGLFGRTRNGEWGIDQVRGRDDAQLT